ncbi:hypothetical protein ACGF12_30430 [Kitasatospora sp. NPDC048296]|uniref:hypothetical protein n=1 Tax=Kitasatospora sp. NPDC048296 TaxID=3364048 RepID=UPI00371B5B8D
MIPNTTTETFHVVNASDLDRFVEAQYGLPYCAHVALEASNGDHCVAKAATEHQEREDPSDPTSPRVGRPGLDPWDQEELTTWLTGDGDAPKPHVLLSDLACRELVPAGTYLIEVNW